jgi:hypothetical protein
VRIDAALADQPQLGEALEERRPDLGALANQHEHLRIAQSLGERVEVLDVVVQRWFADRERVRRTDAGSSRATRRMGLGNGFGDIPEEVHASRSLQVNARLVACLMLDP